MALEFNLGEVIKLSKTIIEKEVATDHPISATTAVGEVFRQIGRGKLAKILSSVDKTLDLSLIIESYQAKGQLSLLTEAWGINFAAIVCPIAANARVDGISIDQIVKLYKESVKELGLPPMDVVKILTSQEDKVRQLCQDEVAKSYFMKSLSTSNTRESDPRVTPVWFFESPENFIHFYPAYLLAFSYGNTKVGEKPPFVDAVLNPAQMFYQAVKYIPEPEFRPHRHSIIEQTDRHIANVEKDLRRYTVEPEPEVNVDDLIKDVFKK